MSIDHPQFDEDVLARGTAAILKTRDGLLRLAVPSPQLGHCVFVNDVSPEEMAAALRKHKEIVATYPRRGEGIEAFVDGSDTGYTDLEAENNSVAERILQNGASVKMNGVANGHADGNGHVNGNGHVAAEKNSASVHVERIGKTTGVYAN